MTCYDAVRAFLIYAFLGWCTEVAYAAVIKGSFVNRGFLNGPVCPIYGFGAVIVIAALSPLKSNILIMFLGSVILTSVLEYITGYALDKIFCDKRWDYSDCKFNINGYICLKFSVAWGAVCLFAVYVIHPAVIAVLGKIPRLITVILLCVFYALLVSDVVLTVTEAVKIKKYFKKADVLEQKIRNFSNTIGQEIADGVLKAEKLKTDISEYRENVQTDVKKRSESSQLKSELEAMYNKFKNLRFKKGYVYKRLSNAYPLYFNKKSKNVSKIRNYFKNNRNNGWGEEK